MGGKACLPSYGCLNNQHDGAVFTIPQNLAAVSLGASHDFQRALTPYIGERLHSAKTLSPNHLSLQLTIGL